MFGFLLRLARSVLDSVLSGLMQQFNVIQEMALAPVQMMMQAVVGGVWKGKGADAFVEELQSLLIPNLETAMQDVTQYSNNLRFAQQVIEQADETVNRLVTSKLVDSFDFF